MFQTLIIDISGDMRSSDGKKDLISERLKAIDKFSKEHSDLKLKIFIPRNYGLIGYVNNNKTVEIILKENSIRSALRCLNEEGNAIFISAGDTGNIVINASSEKILGKLNPSAEPVLITEYPKINGSLILLDVGGTVEYANQESVYTAALYGKTISQILYGKTSIALLNIGCEENKGGIIMEKNRKFLAERFGSDFYGNIEPHEVILQDCPVNVLLTSYFVGNIHIKDHESVFKLLIGKISNSQSHMILKWIFLAMFGLLYKGPWKTLNWKLYSGAYLAGLKKPILITHGRSDKTAFYNALKRAIDHKTEKIFKEIESTIKYFDKNKTTTS